MKKLFGVAVLAFAASASLTAQSASSSVQAPAVAPPPGNVAIGPIFSMSFLGVDSPLQGLGITGKIPGLAPLFGLNFSLSAKENRPRIPDQQAINSSSA